MALNGLDCVVAIGGKGSGWHGGEVGDLIIVFIRVINISLFVLYTRVGGSLQTIYQNMSISNYVEQKAEPNFFFLDFDLNLLHARSFGQN